MLCLQMNELANGKWRDDCNDRLEGLHMGG